MSRLSDIVHFSIRRPNLSGFFFFFLQANALKSTIRELESSILREREFNAASRRINADYLVNILRNFLMSGNPSER